MMFHGSYLIPMGFDFIGWLGRFVQPIISAVVSIIQPIVGAFLKLMGVLLKNLFSSVLFNVYTVLLSALDEFQYIFSRLSGAEMVHKSFGGKLVVGSYLTNYFVNLGIVRTAFFGILALCLILCFVFTLISVTRASMDISGRFAVGEVLRSAMKAFLTFFLLQVIVLTVMSVSNYTLTAVDEVMGIANGRSGANSDVRVANIVFTCSALDAAKDGRSDIFQKGSTLYNYYNGGGSASGSGLMFNQKAVYDHFDITKIDYMMGGVCCILLGYVMLSSIFFFVQRTFEVVFLYLVSPFFVASMPLDGGKRYQGWRDMFLAKCIASYGSVITMRLFFIMAPVMMGGSEGVSLDGIANSSYAYFIRLLFIVGAGFAVKKSQTLLLQIVNPQAAGQADQAVGGFAAMFVAAKGITKGAGDAIRGKNS